MIKFDRIEKLAMDCYEAWFKVNNVEKIVFMQGIESLREFARVDDMTGDDTDICEEIDYIESRLKLCEKDYEVFF